MLLFSVTGFTLNHASWIGAKPEVTTQTAQLPAPLLEQLKKTWEANGRRKPRCQRPVADWLGETLSVRVEHRETEWSDDEIYVSLPRPGGDAWLTVDLEDGEVTHELTDRGWLSYSNDLHKGRNAGAAWSLFIDVFAFCGAGVRDHRTAAAENARGQSSGHLADGRPGTGAAAAAGDFVYSLKLGRMRTVTRLAGAVLLMGASAAAFGAELNLKLEIPRLDVAEYHRPYVAVWVENQDQSTAAQLAVWYQTDSKKEDGTQWLKDLRQWWRRGGRELQMPVDGVTGATASGRRARAELQGHGQATRQARSPANTTSWSKPCAKSADASCCACPSNGPAPRNKRRRLEARPSSAPSPSTSLPNPLREEQP